VSVTQNLKQVDQCKKIAKTAQTVLSQVLTTDQAFHFRDRHVSVRLYFQYIRPHLEFAVPAWSPWREGDKEVLEKVQKRK
jgi:hypothetical protein